MGTSEQEMHHLQTTLLQLRSKLDEEQEEHAFKQGQMEQQFVQERTDLQNTIRELRDEWQAEKYDLEQENQSLSRDSQKTLRNCKTSFVR